MKAKECGYCRNTGWLIYVNFTIERCDNCARFKGDLDAAQAYFKQNGIKTYTLKFIQLVPNQHGRKP